MNVIIDLKRIAKIQATLITTLFVLVTCSTTVAYGQSLEEIQIYGPDRNLFRTDALKSAVASWKWQVQLSERKQELLQTKVDLLKAQVDTTRELLEDVSSVAGEQISVDQAAIRSLDSDISQLKSLIVETEAQLSEAQIQAIQTQEVLAQEIQQQQGEIELLELSISAVSEEYKRVKKLFEQKATSNNELKIVQIRIQEATTELSNAHKSLALLKKRQVSEVTAKSLAIISQQLADLKSQLSKKQETRQIANDSKFRATQDQLNSRVRLLEKMIEETVLRKHKLELDNIQNQALLQLTNEMNSPQAEGSQEDDGEENEDDN